MGFDIGFGWRVVELCIYLGINRMLLSLLNGFVGCDLGDIRVEVEV